jgi:hypothetical protein
MKKLSFFIVMLLLSNTMFAQVAVNTDGNPPDPSAMLDVKSISSGFLPPRMSAEQILAITTPANGLIVFCTTDNKFYAFVTGVNTWKEILYGPGSFFSCGNSITINHKGGVVAPVDKTVTYGTTNNITGELTKCWITRNLGASQQATVVSDATEASAGWYWQFNRKQGYKYEGTTRTPNTAWITSISENSDWLSANDPCTNELGNSWRIPTYTEWTNVDASWTNWNGPYGSALKLHAAGNLYTNDGILRERGSYGYYWSSTQGSVSNGWSLYFYSALSGMSSATTKPYGFPLRCVRD